MIKIFTDKSGNKVRQVVERPGPTLTDAEVDAIVAKNNEGNRADPYEVGLDQRRIVSVVPTDVYMPASSRDAGKYPKQPQRYTVDEILNQKAAAGNTGKPSGFWAVLDR